MGDRRGTLHLAGTPPSTTLGGVATASHPAQLPLPWFGIPGPGRRIARSAACLRDCRGLWRHRRSSSGVALAAVAATCPRLTRRVDLQRLGLSRSRERLLPGQCDRPFAWAVGRDLLHSHADRAAAAHHARPRVPGSSAVSTGARDGAEPTASARIEAVNTFENTKWSVRAGERLLPSRSGTRQKPNGRHTLIRGASMKLLLPFILSAYPLAAVAQSQSPSAQPPSDAPSPKTTEVMVILTAKEGVTRQQIMNLMPSEIRATVRLYLDGKIRQWYSRGDGRGAIFLIDAKTVEEAHAVVDTIPLSKENLMDHEYIPVGPLMPLTALIAR